MLEPEIFYWLSEGKVLVTIDNVWYMKSVSYDNKISYIYVSQHELGKAIKRGYAKITENKVVFNATSN